MSEPSATAATAAAAGTVSTGAAAGDGNGGGAAGSSGGGGGGGGAPVVSVYCTDHALYPSPAKTIELHVPVTATIREVLEQVEKYHRHTPGTVELFINKNQVFRPGNDLIRICDVFSPEVKRRILHVRFAGEHRPPTVRRRSFSVVRGIICAACAGGGQSPGGGARLFLAGPETSLVQNAGALVDRARLTCLQQRLFSSY
jgi:hypothetical protein